MGRLSFRASPIRGVVAVDRTLVQDERGVFARLFCAAELVDAGWSDPVVQINYSLSHRKGTIRGMHYQLPPAAEMKLVSCVRGAVLDVAIDLRSGSPTFLQHHAEKLSGDEGGGLIIPPGCAHGFQALTDDVQLIYCHSRAFDPTAERGLDPFDPVLSIAWPEPVTAMSERDCRHPTLTADFQGVVV